MRPLLEIIDAARSGESVEHDELLYAVCALDALSTFDHKAMLKLVEAEQENLPAKLIHSALFQAEEQHRRWKTALQTDPKSWVGWNNDPRNPEFVKRRKAHIQLAKKIIGE